MRRITFELDSDSFDRFQKLPWGTRSACLRESILRIIELHEKYGMSGVGAFLDRQDKRFVQNLNTTKKEA